MLMPSLHYLFPGRLASLQKILVNGSFFELKKNLCCNEPCHGSKYAKNCGRAGELAEPVKTGEFLSFPHDFITNVDPEFFDPARCIGGAFPGSVADAGDCFCLAQIED
jgi:hypothetical protein